MDAIYVERLTRLAELVEKIPVEEFEMSAWFKTGPSCGTIGCAAGWAALDPWFQDQGLRLIVEWSGRTVHRGRKPKVTKMDTLYFNIGLNQGKGKSTHWIGSKGLAEFFGITDEESEGIFTPLAYRARRKPGFEKGKILPQEVVAQIRKVLASYNA